MSARITKLVLIALMASAPALAHYSVQDTGELLEPGRYAVGTELQFVTSGDDGANILGKFDAGFSDSFNFRGIVGTGDTDFQLQALVKWVPIPDFEKQPAFGVLAGPLYARYSGENELSLRVVPFVSKKFEVEFGTLTPYAALPFAIRTYDSDTDAPFQFALGTKYSHPDLKGADFTAEIGFDIDKAYNYISFGAIFPLSESNRFQFLED